MTDFDRIPAPREDDRSRAGARAREAMFSQTHRRQLSFVCADCGAATPVTPRSVAGVGLSVAVVAPWRRRPLNGVCRACRRRTWMEITHVHV